LLRRDAIVVSDISQGDCEKAVKEIEGTGVGGLAVKCDVSKKAEVDNLIAKTMEKFGKLDILVNNAGIFPAAPFLSMNEADWDKVLDVNLKSVFMCSQNAARVMKPGSKIINISSIASLRGFEELTHYCASKAGMNGLTRAIALELAPKEINVNAVAPGATETPGLKESMDEDGKMKMIPAIPLRRMGSAEDVANAVIFLASGKAEYITGQIIVVDGGWTIK